MQDFLCHKPKSSTRGVKVAAPRASRSVFENMNKIHKTDAEWQRELTPEQFKVLRQKGTERPGSYREKGGEGVYVCAGCGLELFSSDQKFESGTGWPSFTQPIASTNVEEETDVAYGMRRTEVLCAQCEGHLGHVFEDGPAPTGLRYCMNGVAMKLESKK